MLLNEHDSKRLLSRSGIPVPPGVAVTPPEVDDFAPDFAPPWFVKAQVLAGGRGKAGGIRRVDAAADFAATTRGILDMDIRGHRVPLVRVEPASAIEREFYLSLSVSRERACVVLTTGREGGVEIENLGPDNLLVQEISLPGTIRPHHYRAAFFHLGLDKDLFKPFSALLSSLWKALQDSHLLLAEINPLVLTPEGTFLALDGKVEIDDNMADLSEELAAFHRDEHFARRRTRRARPGSPSSSSEATWD